jgi:hypothetical protein
LIGMEIAGRGKGLGDPRRHVRIVASAVAGRLPVPAAWPAKEVRVLGTARIVAVALTATLGGAAVVAAVGLPPTAAGISGGVPPAAAADRAPVQAATARADRPAPVQPLKSLRAPDLFVSGPRSLTPAQVAALRRIPGVQALTVLDAGTVRVGAGPAVRLAGVDPSQFRQFTPRETAASDGLWQAVARGEAAATYGLARSRHLTLGGTTEVRGVRSAPLRLGALAVFALPGVDLVIGRSPARALGAVPDSAVLLTAPGRAIGELRLAVRTVTGEGAAVHVLRPPVVVPYKGKPRTYHELYVASAAYCPGLRWQVLAAIGQVESGHGRDVGPSSAGALGPMQFLPSTWAFSGVDGDGDGRADVMNPFDAVPAAALYLCRAGAAQGEQGLYDAIFSYNHADWYVKKVLDLAARYR